nr:peptide chain release factor-like protein [Nitrospirota bacterium]
MKTLSPRPSPPPYSTDPARLARDVVVETFRAGGPGGQHRNVTDSAVRLLHRPSGIQVVASESRSQHRNRAVAFERLVARLERLNRVPVRRVPTRVSKGGIARRLAEKKRRQTTKRLREIPRDEQ